MVFFLLQNGFNMLNQKPFILVQGWLHIPIKVIVTLNTFFANLASKSPESKFSNRGFQGGQKWNSKKQPCVALSKACPYSKLFWSLFSRIWTEYEEIVCISPYSVRMWENTDQNNSEYGHFLRSVDVLQNKFS